MDVKERVRNLESDVEGRISKEINDIGRTDNPGKELDQFILALKWRNPSLAAHVEHMVAFSKLIIYAPPKPWFYSEKPSKEPQNDIAVTKVLDVIKNLEEQCKHLEEQRKCLEEQRSDGAVAQMSDAVRKIGELRKEQGRIDLLSTGAAIVSGASIFISIVLIVLNILK